MHESRTRLASFDFVFWLGSANSYVVTSDYYVDTFVQEHLQNFDLDDFDSTFHYFQYAVRSKHVWHKHIVCGLFQSFIVLARKCGQR